jgi:hypothetical protein
MAALGAVGHNLFSLGDVDGQRNLEKKFILADGHVINYCFTWQTVSDTVFGLRFSVFCKKSQNYK